MKTYSNTNCNNCFRQLVTVLFFIVLVQLATDADAYGGGGRKRDKTRATGAIDAKTFDIDHGAGAH